MDAVALGSEATEFRVNGDRVTLAPEDYALSTLIDNHRGQRPPSIHIRASDPAVLLMSGGTTGTPKGVLGNHGAYFVAGTQILAWISTVLGRGDSVILLPLPSSWGEVATPLATWIGLYVGYAVLAVAV